MTSGNQISGTKSHLTESFAAKLLSLVMLVGVLGGIFEVHAWQHRVRHHHVSMLSAQALSLGAGGVSGVTCQRMLPGGSWSRAWPARSDGICYSADEPAS